MNTTKMLIGLSLVYCNLTLADTIKIAVIDTGFDFDATWNSNGMVAKPKLCATGHKDFTGAGIKDTHGHGTHIAGLVGSYSDNSDYCLIILKYYLKYYDEKATGNDNLSRSVAAIKYAKELKVDFINYSGGGMVASSIEKSEVIAYLNQGGIFVAAAGNEGVNTDLMGYYPANYDSRVIVVGATLNSGERYKTSNYGDSIDFSVIGKDVLSILPNGQFGYMSGTSQATAKITGFLVNKQNVIKLNRSINRDNRTAN